jgi:hypothetical protein
MPKYRITKHLSYVVSIECEAFIEAANKNEIEINLEDFNPTQEGEEIIEKISTYSDCLLIQENSYDLLRFANIEEIDSEECQNIK